jgi:serine/threonine-protein kinase HipA
MAFAIKAEVRAPRAKTFAFTAPEGTLKEHLRNHFAKAIPEFDDLDLLSIVGSSQIGRLRYSTHEQLVEDIPTQDIDEILTYRGTADLFVSLLERFATYSGISGVQPKVLVRQQDAPDNHRPPADSRPHVTHCIQWLHCENAALTFS